MSKQSIDKETAQEIKELIEDLFERNLETITEEAAERAVEKAFLRVGLDISQPREVQEDFIFLRNWRRGAQIGYSRVFQIALGAMTLGILSILYQNFIPK